MCITSVTLRNAIVSQVTLCMPISHCGSELIVPSASNVNIDLYLYNGYTNSANVVPAVHVSPLVKLL